MDDAELSYWGMYGRRVSMNDTPLAGSRGPGEDIVTLWNVVGELERKVRELGG